ncbi:MAG: DUF6273 domain-containing protein [Candidatus Faecivicinus sp.]
MQASQTPNAEEIYQQAKELYTHYANTGDLQNAEAMFEQLGGFKSAAAYAQRCRTLIQYAVGGTVTMGSWDGRPIRWRVADARGKLRLLLAEDAFLQRPYNDLRVDVSWKTSTLRRWLNGEFLDAAFTREERAAVIAGRVDNPRNPKFFTQGGAPSMDKVFILTLEEIEKYLPAQQERALGRWWWVRMPGCNLLSAVSVCEDGSIYDIGINVNYESGGVRPALWVLLRV